MGRKRTLAEELAELATPAPVRGPDLDIDDLGEAAKLQESDADEPEKLPESKRARKAAEKPLRLRVGIDLQNKEYAGKRTTRADAFTAGEDSEDMLDQPDSTADNSTSDASLAEDYSDSGPSDLPGSGEEAEPYESEPGRSSSSGDRPETQGLTAMNGNGSISEPAVVRHEGSGPAQERARSSAVRSQKRIWERVLELRIMLQQIVTASHRLPPPDSPALITKSAQAVFQEGQSVLSALLELHGAIVDSNPSKQLEKMKAAMPSILSEPSSLDKLWAAVDSSYNGIGHFRDSSLDRWYRKTLIGSGQALLKGNQRLLEQSISAQVTHIMTNAKRQARISRLPRHDAPAQLCARVENDDGNDDADPERYDDREFYSQLLREFLDSHSVSEAGLATSAVKASKKASNNRDRRASKGRRLRYEVQEKLINFMVPLKYEEPPMASQLFSNLFGRQGN